MADKLNSILDEIVKRNLKALHASIGERRKEMESDDVGHLELYELLGFSREEGLKVDQYQNTGRFLYKYSGALIEEATVAVLRETKGGKAIRIPNTVGSNPKNFQIDCFVKSDNKAHEIKWRDATTDGDHVRKERDKVGCIRAAGMIPVKLMFYMPNREQAKEIQTKIIAVYRATGEAYVGQEAWDYVKEYTGFDLRNCLYKRCKEAGS